MSRVSSIKSAATRVPAGAAEGADRVVRAPVASDVDSLSRQSLEPSRGHAARGGEPGGARLRVLIADPDPLVRRVVREELQRAPGFLVVAHTGHGREAVELARYYRPDLVVMEVRLPGFDGVSAVRQMIGAAPQARVVVLSAEVGGDLPLSALRAGAEGYLPKDLDSGALARALRKVADGEAVVPRALTKPLLESLRRMPDSGWRPLHSQLTTREWEIIELLDAGACTRGIAEELTLSRATVYSHVKNILRKLEVKSRAEAVLAAQRLRPAEVGITT